MIALLRCLRPHQWAKNLLVALPLLASHRLGDSEAWLRIGVAFASFSLGASAMYVFNDLRDRDSDRQHPEKSNRPIASGAVSVPAAVVLMLACLAAAAALALLVLPIDFTAWLAWYLALSGLYSFRLKRMLMIDVLTLAALYALRLLAGGAAVPVALSAWLLAFGMFMFLSIAFAKRYVELRTLHSEGREQSPGRAYMVIDLDLIRTLGPTSGYMAVVVFALYLNSPEAALLYPRVDWLWLICPLLLYWITRLWFAAQRGSLHHDPVIFALTDKASYAVGIAVALVAMLASMPLR